MTDKNIIAGAPTEEPARQQYFMEQVKKLVEAESAKKGRPLTCFINTFGCQMNARDSEKLLGILKEAGGKILNLWTRTGQNAHKVG